MSSTKKAKLDLILRVRYTNPVPPPSFPPLLIALQPDLPRLAREDYIAEYASQIPLPMVVDGEGGMRVEMNDWDGVWWGDLDAINPSQPLPTSSLHPTDALLLQPPSLPSAPAPIPGSSTSTPASSLPGIFASSSALTRVAAGTLRQTLHKPDVSWLRNTTYLQARSSGASVASSGSGGSGGGGKLRKLGSKNEDEMKEKEVPDDSMFAQLQTIERSFFEYERAVRASEGSGLGEEVREKEVLRHPERRHLTMVDSFEILPNDETFANEYNWVLFPERPMELGDDKPISQERLSAAILRPQQISRQKHFMELFVPQSDEELVELERVRRDVLMSSERREEEGEGIEANPCKFKYIRDYDYDALSTDPSGPLASDCFILTFSDGTSPAPLAASPVKMEEDDDDDLFGEDEDEKAGAGPTVSKFGGPVTTASAAAGVETGGKEGKRKRGKGVYWTPIGRRLVVKKRRMAKDEQPDKSDPWDFINVHYEALSQQLVEQRAEAAEMVMDENWTARWLRSGEGEGEGLGEGEGEDLRS